MYCDKDYEKCVDTCEFNKANDCLMNCGRIFTMCVESCPCHTDCIQGCEGCPNPICYCNVSFDLISLFGIFCCIKNTFQDVSKDENLKACKDELSLELGNCFFECESKNQTSYFQRFSSYDYASEGCTACEERCKEDFENGFLNCPCQVHGKTGS